MEEASRYKESGSEAGLYEPPPQAANNDIELELEIRYASILKQKRQLEQENDRIRNQMADITTRLEHLQESHDTLRDRLVETEDKLRAPQRDDDTQMFIRRLEDKIREQDELIESQEGQVDQDRDEKARMRRELESLRKAAKRTIQLEDELKELRLESIELAKKANTADRFKQKLEGQKALENDLKNIEYENEELRAMLRDYTKIKERNESMEQTQILYQNSIAKAEMEIFEIHNQKKHLDQEKAELERELSSMEDRKAHDEQLIQDLQDELRLKDSAGAGISSLEDELESEDATQRATNLEISRLRAEIAVLKGNAFAAQENGTVRAQLEEAMAYRKVIEAKYRDAFEKEAISQQQLRLMMSSVEDNTKFVELAMSVGRLALLTPEYYRHQAFIDLKLAHGRLTEDFAALQKKYDTLNEEHNETERQLLETSSDLKLIDKDELDKLDEFKATQESLVASYETELTALKSKNKALQIDFDLQKTHLTESLLKNAKLQNNIEETIKDEEDAKSAEVSKQSSARRVRGYGRRASVAIPERIRKASDVAKELVAERNVFRGRLETVTPTTSSSSRSRSGARSGSSSISSAHSVEEAALASERHPSVVMVDIPLSPRSTSSSRKPSAVVLPASMPGTPREELYKVGLGRSLTAAFTGGRTADARASIAEDREGNYGTSGMDDISDSNRDSLHDIIVYGDVEISMAPQAPPKAATESTIGLAISTDGMEDVTQGPTMAELFQKSFAWMDQQTTAQRQAELIEEAKQRKAERERVEKEDAKSAKKRFSLGRLFGRNKK